MSSSTIFGMDGPSVLVAGAILLSAILGGLIALFTIGHQRMIARKKAAYDLVLSSQRPDLLRSKRIFLERRGRGKWKRIVGPRTSKDREQRSEIARYLNHLEATCVAIRQNIVDEGVLKATMGDTLVRHYSEARLLIHLIRTKEGDDEIYEHFEYVAKKWKDYPKIPTRNVLRSAFSQVSKT